MADKKKSVVESAAPASDKKKALETAMAQIEKTYGKGSIMRLGDNADIVVEAIPTGSLSLDLALGIGGVPKGRIIAVSYTHLDVYKRQPQRISIMMGFWSCPIPMP